MTKHNLLFLILLSAFGAQAQTSHKDSTDAPYLRFPGLPPFDLLQPDSSTHLTKEKIEKKHNVLIMFFSPDCPHCQHQTEDILAGMDSLKDVQIVMATYQPFQEMKEFYAKYQLSKYPNIKMGRDGTFFLPPYYRMKSLPYLALYNKHGILITTFEGNQKVAALVNAFEKSGNN